MGIAKHSHRLTCKQHKKQNVLRKQTPSFCPVNTLTWHNSKSLQTRPVFPVEWDLPTITVVFWSCQLQLCTRAEEMQGGTRSRPETSWEVFRSRKATVEKPQQGQAAAGAWDMCRRTQATAAAQGYRCSGINSLTSASMRQGRLKWSLET